MISLASMPSSMAIRVRSGRQSIATRRSSMVAGRRVRLGCAAGRARGPATVTATVEALKRSPAAKGTLHMKLGVNVGYWGLGMGPQDQLEVVQEAERLGYDSVWAAEAYGSDAGTVLAWLAAGDTRVRFGSG